jgi:hypothetical protein
MTDRGLTEALETADSALNSSNDSNTITLTKTIKMMIMVITMLPLAGAKA